MIKLNKNTQPDDLSAKMPLRYELNGDVLKDKDGVEGWVEFWSDDALPIKARLKTGAGRLYKIQLRQSKRTARELEAMSDEALSRELDEFKGLQIEALVIRTKAWHLVDSDGAVIDIPVTPENARELYDDDAFRAYVSDWLENSKEAFLPTKRPS